jgi:hypothetical protein
MAMNERKEITAATLKWIAVITMIIDHFGASILETWLYRSQLPYYDWMLQLDRVCRSIGRMAFPIFIFLMIEGLYHTRNRWKYLARLLLLAFISEVPFDCAFFLSRYQFDNHVFIEFGYQNVFVTLSIGLFMCILLEKVRPRTHHFALDREMEAQTGNPIVDDTPKMILLKALACVVIMVACAYANEFLRADYGATGIIGFIGMYWGNVWFRENWRTFLLGVAGLTMLNRFEMVAVVDLFFITRYQGTKGKSMNKWFFYFVYPVHLAIYGFLVWKFII